MWKGQGLCIVWLLEWSRVLVCRLCTSSPCALVQIYPRLTSCQPRANSAFIQLSATDETKLYLYLEEKIFILPTTVLLCSPDLVSPVQGQGRHSQTGIQKSGGIPKTHEIFSIARFLLVFCCLLLSHCFSCKVSSF